jgi:hypothetical protein
MPADISPGVLPDYFEFTLSHNANMSPSTLLVRKSILEVVGGFPVGVRYGEDLDTWVRLAWSGKIGFVPETLVVYHADAENRVMNVAAPDRKYGLRPVLDTYRRWEREGRIPAALRLSSRRYMQYVWVTHVRELADAGDLGEARWLFITRCRVGICGWRCYLQTAAYVGCPRRCLSWFRALFSAVSRSRRTPLPEKSP